jgi:orotate phosphoribosyltransferase
MEPKIPDIEKMRNRLLELVLEYAFQFSETPAFKLAHGGTSRFYFNCKRITLDPEGQYLVGNLVFEAVKELGISAIGGLTLGADPIANATAYSSWLRGWPIQSFIVRKTSKDHGIIAAIEGKVTAGDRVVVVDDVVTTGGSTLQAISACRQAGLDIVGVLTLIDRQEMNGRENIEKQIPNFKALFTRDEVTRMYRGLNPHG